MSPLLKEIAELWKEYEEEHKKEQNECAEQGYMLGKNLCVENFLHFLTTKL